MTQAVIQPSFASGEISPSLWGRVDLAKYRVGAAKMLNFFVDYKGGASTRPGTVFVGMAYKSATAVRLIKFQFSTIQTYVLEFGDLYMRVIKDGAYVLEANKSITGVSVANPAVITSNAHGYSNGDWVFISGLVGPTGLNGKTYIVAGATTNTFTLLDLYSGAAVANAVAYVSGGTVARYYTLTTPWAAADISLLKFTQSADVMTFCHPSYPPYDLTRTGHAAWTLTGLTFGSTVPTPTGLNVSQSGTGTDASMLYQVTAVDSSGQESVPTKPFRLDGVTDYTTTKCTNIVSWNPVAGAQYYNVYRSPIARDATSVAMGIIMGYSGNAFGARFTDSNIAPDYTKTPPLHYNPFAKSPITDVTINASGSGYTNASVASVTDSTGSGAVLIPIISSGGIQSFIILNGGENYTSPSISVTVGTGGSFTAVLGFSSGTYPSVVAYFQQRKWFAASKNFPETLYASKPGAFKNFDYSNPTNDADSLQLTLASQEVNDIRWLVPMQGGMVVLTGGGAWLVSGGSADAPISATSNQAKPQAFNGCSNVQPLVINYDILYVQAKGSIVRDLSYNFYVNVYTGTDLTILSNHLFSPRFIVDWTWAEEPHKLIWAVRDDGKLLSCAFLKEQEVYGWSPHETQGLAKSITSISDGTRDVVYMVIERVVNGTTRKYIERFAPREYDIEDAISGGYTGVEKSWCVDCGLSSTLGTRSGTLSADTYTGSAVFTCSASVFVPGDVGSVIRYANGIATVTAYTSGTQVTGTWTETPNAFYPQTTNLVPSTDWTITAPFTTISGLDHLEGQTVQILGDGGVFPAKTVTGGTVTVNRPITYAIVGLQFIAQLQTLDLEVQSPPGTVQGLRKKLSRMTVKVQGTRGLKYGTSFDLLTEHKDRSESMPLGNAIPLFTGQWSVNNDPSWDVEGRICFQADYPLPATILAVAPEIDIGD